MPKNHVKPTAEELEAEAQAKAAEIEEAIAKEEAEKKAKLPKDPPKQEETPEDDKEEETPKEEEKEEEAPPIEEKKEEPDYKEKFIASSKEALIQRAKAEKAEITNNAIEQAAEVTDIPEDVIKTEYPEWDDMTTTEQKLAKESYVNRERFRIINEAAKKGKVIEEWNKKVDTFIEDPKTLSAIPELEGKQEEFKSFASKPTHRGVDFSVLASAFLHDAAATQVKHKGQMFPAGSAGAKEKDKPKSDKISLEQAKILRETDYPKYKEYLKAGKIDYTGLDQP